MYVLLPVYIVCSRGKKSVPSAFYFKGFYMCQGGSDHLPKVFKGLFYFIGGTQSNGIYIKPESE